MMNNLSISNDKIIIFIEDLTKDDYKMNHLGIMAKRLLKDYFFNTAIKSFDDIDEFYEYFYNSIISVLINNWYIDIFYPKYNIMSYLNLYNDKEKIIKLGKEIVNYLTNDLTNIIFKEYEEDDEGKVVFLSYNEINKIREPFDEDYYKVYKKYYGLLKTYEPFQFSGNNYIFDLDRLIEIHNSNLLKNDDEIMKWKINTFRKYANGLFI